MNQHPIPPTHIEKNSRTFLQVAFALFLAGFATFALLYCVQPMLPVFSESFKISAAQSSLLLSSATSALAFGLLFTGPISDAIGRKSVMITALLSAAFFTFISAFSQHWYLLITCRILVGLSLSGLAAVAMAYLNEEIAPQHLGTAMGLYIGGNAIGGMSGRVISGVLIDFFSWHVVLAAMGFVALAAAFLFWYLLPASKHFEPTPLKLTKLFNGYIYHLLQPKIPLLLLLGFLLMGSFVSFFNYIGYHLLAEPYLLSQAWIGILSIVYLPGSISSTKFGAMADRFGHNKVLWFAISIMVAGATISLLTPLALVFVGMLIFALGFFGSHTLTSSWIGHCAKKAKGQASALYLFCYYMGSSIMGTAGGVFWQHYQWLGVIGFINAMLFTALIVAIFLRIKAPND